MSASLETQVLHEIWAPSAPVLPFMLLIFLCWSVACGEYRLLPLTVLVASFVTQCHLAYAMPTLGMFVVALGGLATRGAEPRAPPARSTSSALALLVGIVCWSVAGRGPGTGLGWIRLWLRQPPNPGGRHAVA